MSYRPVTDHFCPSDLITLTAPALSTLITSALSTLSTLTFLLLQACLDLYSATLEESWLELAEQMQEVQDRLFLDREQGGYFTSR